MLLKCPECGSTHINQNQTTAGAIWCERCDFSAEQKEIHNPFLVETATTASVATHDAAGFKPSGNHYNKPFFSITDKELTSLIKKSMLPHRVTLFTNAYKTNDIYLKHIKSGLTFSLAKFNK